jgi:hypothetical protein
MYTQDRPGLSSERAPHRDRRTNSRHKHLKRKKYLVKRPQSGLDVKTYRLNVSRKVILTLTLVDKANVIAECLQNQFTPHDLCDENHERRVKASVQALLEAED